MGIFLWLGKIFFGFVPPSVWKILRGARLAPIGQNPDLSHDKARVDRDTFVWEVFMSMTAVMGILFGLSAAGILPVLGTGYALASDQNTVRQQVVATRLEQLEWRMFDLRVKQCEAIKRGESPQIFTIQLEQQMKVYREISGKEPQLPGCNQL